MWLTFHQLLKERARGKKFTFVQIGAHDGKRDDPINRYIKKYKWKGLLVEPVPRYFDDLRKTYRDQSGLKFANYAVGKKSGIASIYGVSERAPWWMWQLVRTKDSFSKKVLLRRTWYIPGLANYVEEKKVKTAKLGQLLRSYGIGHVNLMVVDTEGYDYEVLKQVEMTKSSPDMILLEHMHLSSTDCQSAWALLVEHGYVVTNDRQNTFAYKKDRGKAVLESRS